MGVTITMSNDPPFIQLLRPLLGLVIEDDNLRSNVEETARIYFDDENSSTTINLIPAIIILGLLLILGLKLAGIPVLQSFGLDGLVSGGGSGEGGFGVIEERGYTSGGGYEGYDAAYTRDEFAAKVGYLQEQINALTLANEALASQVFLESGAQTGVTTNLIASS